MTPSMDPVQTMSFVTGTMQSIDIGWPGKRSLMLPHSPQLKMFNVPSPVPHTTFSPPWKKITIQCDRYTYKDNVSFLQTEKLGDKCQIFDLIPLQRLKQFNNLLNCRGIKIKNTILVATTDLSGFKGFSDLNKIFCDISHAS